MLKYDFDQIIERRGTDALKTDALKPRYGNSDLIPLWVADMDFATPDFIIDALKDRLSHPIFGYTVVSDSYYGSIINWVKGHHDWNIRREWISFIPGIVTGIAIVMQAFTKPGDKIIIQPPVYHPFRLVPEHNDREIVNNPLIPTEDGYEMDLDGLERIIDEKCKLLILCNPHNPVGIVWSKETLLRLAAICKKHGILVISDEIHSDMALWDKHHLPFASVSEDAASNSITFMAPSKTFNIAGIISSYAIVPNEEIRTKFFSFLSANELNEAPIFSIEAAKAAYNNGEAWRLEMIEYIQDNILFVDQYLNDNIPSIKAIKPQASFLVWLDCRELGLSQSELNDLFINKAHLALNDGAMFGPGGEGFMRLNIGTPRANLKLALDNLLNAIKQL